MTEKRTSTTSENPKALRDEGYLLGSQASKETEAAEGRSGDEQRVPYEDAGPGLPPGGKGDPGPKTVLPRQGPAFPRQGPAFPRQGPAIPRQGPVVPRQGPTILAEIRWSRGKDQWSRGRDQRFWRKSVGPGGGNVDPAAGSGDFELKTAVLAPRRPSPGGRRLHLCRPFRLARSTRRASCPIRTQERRSAGPLWSPTRSR
jgi:hypothetical protein